MSGRVAIVTGAAAGIGRAIAHRLAAEGATVVAVDMAESGLAAPHLSRVADVADEAAARAIVAEAADRFGRIDVLVNNAGIVREMAASGVDLDDWRRVIEVNLTAPYVWSRLVAPHMAKAGGGRIVNMSSHAAARGTLLKAHYAASKAGLEGLTRTMAVELAGDGITVNAVAPGAIETDRNRGSHAPGRRSAWLRAIPLGRYGQVDDVAAMTAFLAGPEAGYVTGQVFAVDGGFLAAGLKPD